MIGIYRLVFSNEFAYIGQSINIEQRVDAHMRAMKLNKHSNKHIQLAYELYGTPTWEVLQICTILELDKLEARYLKDEALETLNIAVIRNDPQREVMSFNCKYTEEQLTQAFLLLSDKSNRDYTHISNISGVNISTIRAIACGIEHTWLNEKYPLEYYSMVEANGTRQKAMPKKCSKYTRESVIECIALLGNPKIPYKEIMEKTNIPISSISSIARGTSYSSLKHEIPETYNKMLAANPLRRVKGIVIVIDPEGVEHTVVSRTAFANLHNIRKQSFLALCNNDIESYHGWKLKK